MSIIRPVLSSGLEIKPRKNVLSFLALLYQPFFISVFFFVDINIFAGAVGSTRDNPLSKWFDKDVLQQIPSKGSSQIPSGKVLSVEELENKQR